MSVHPDANLLTREEVAERLKRSTKWVDQARHATDPDASPRPMPGWVNIGGPTKPALRLPESALIDYIRQQPAA